MIHAECQSSLELVFAVENTGRTNGQAVWSQIQNYLFNLVDQFTISSNNVRISFVTYADNAIVNFPLNQYNDANSVKSAINNVQYFGSGTANLAAALNSIQSQVINLHTGLFHLIGCR